MPFCFPADPTPATLGYTQNPLDRMSEQRVDDTWRDQLAWNDTARFIVLIGDKVVIDRRNATVLLEARVAGRLGVGPHADSSTTKPGQEICLGLAGAEPGPHQREHINGRAARFAGLSSFDPEAVPAFGLDVIDLRSLVLTAAVPADEAGSTAQARALYNWHLSHPFCAKCGNPSQMSQGGYRRDCPTCSAQHFPRTDPVVIMGIIDPAQNRVLLGRQARFIPGMYSCLAGFLEPGETIEDAVRRETWEEAGIRVGRVGYHSSQPWPFPASLMIGCIGEALTTEIVPDQAELEDCRWFSRAEAIQMLDGTHPDGLSSPKPLAIAHHLLKAFIEMT